MRLGPAVRLGLGLLATALFTWLMLRKQSVGGVAAAFAHAQLFPLLLGLLAFMLGYVCRIVRWQLMLRLDNPVLRWSECAGPFLACVAANNVLPLRAGDALRTVAFNRALRIGTPTAVASLLVERLLDLLTLLALLGAAVALFGPPASMLAGSAGMLLLAGAATILLVLLRPAIFRRPLLAMASALARLGPPAAARLVEGCARIFSTLEALGTGSVMGRLALWSAAAWAGEGLAFWFCAFALPSLTQPAGAWLAFPVGTLSTLIPSTPGYIGTFDYFTAEAMASAGNAGAAAAAYAVLVHAVLWLPPTLAGGVFLLLYPVRRSPQTTS